MSQLATIPQQLPVNGPFRVQPGFLSKKMAGAIGMFILALVIFAIAVIFIGYTANNLLQTSRIWKQGVDAADGSLSGKVRTRYLVFKSYNLHLEYKTEDGRTLTRKIEFERFFTGPNEGESFSIRYLEDAPELATVSWAHDALVHGWIWVVLLCFVGFAVLGGVIGSARKHLHDRRLVMQLAQQGQLIRAEIQSIKTKIEEQGDTKIEVTCYEYTFELNGAHTGEHKVPPKHPSPWLLDENKALVLLASPTLPEHRVLNADGSPLAL